MSGRDSGDGHRSELSVFTAGFTARRQPVVDLTAADEGWAPVASSPFGDVPLAEVLDRLLAGLGDAAQPPR